MSHILYYLNPKQAASELISDAMHATYNKWVEPHESIFLMKELLTTEYERGYQDALIDSATNV